MARKIGGGSPPTLSVFTSLFEFMPTRAQRRMVDILEGAIKSYVKYGVESTTYDSIAKEAKISRPLVLHYFKDKDAVYEMAMKYVRANFQRLAVEAIQKTDDPEEQLRNYLSALFQWNEKYPLHAKVWNLVYYYAAVNERIRKIHSELTLIGHDRITTLLTRGVDSGVFAPGEIRARAKMIQTLYTGALVMLTSENLYVDTETYHQLVSRSILTLAKNPLQK